MLFVGGKTESSVLDMLQFEKFIKHLNDVWRAVGYTSLEFRGKLRNGDKLFVVSIHGTR